MNECVYMCNCVLWWVDTHIQGVLYLMHKVPGDRLQAPLLRGTENEFLDVSCLLKTSKQAQKSVLKKKTNLSAFHYKYTILTPKEHKEQCLLLKSLAKICNFLTKHYICYLNYSRHNAQSYLCYPLDICTQTANKSSISIAKTLTTTKQKWRSLIKWRLTFTDFLGWSWWMWKSDTKAQWSVYILSV